MKAPSRFSQFVVALKKCRSYVISEQFRKIEFLQFSLLFCTNKEQIKNNNNALQKVNVVFGICVYGKIFILYKTEKYSTFVLISFII